METIEKCRNIALGGSVPYQINRTVREADEVVIRVFDGDAMITVKALDMHEKHVSAGEEYRVPLLSRERIELRIVNLVSEESICKWDFYEQGGLLGDDRVGPAKYRSTKSLKEENNVERSLRKAWGDEMVFRVEQGAVLIKLGQHNTLEFWQ